MLILRYCGWYARYDFAVYRTGQSRADERLYCYFVLLGIAVTAGIVYIERAQRRVPVNYAQKQQQGRKIYAQQSHLPLKLNMAGLFQPFCQFIVVVSSKFRAVGRSINRSYP